MVGMVKSFSPAHGYGFIMANDIEFWFHATELSVSRDAIKDGMIVEFDPVRTGKGFRAEKIRRTSNGK